MNQPWHRNRPAGDRVLEMLAILQLGLYGRCGRARYATRRTARRAARIAAPGVRLRAYRCGDAWHLANSEGRPQYIALPVTQPVALAPPSALHRAGLDRWGGGERGYRRPGPDGRARWQGSARTSGRRDGPDPLEDAHDTDPHLRTRPAEVSR